MVKGNDTAYRSFYDAYYKRLSRYLLVVTAGDEDASFEALQGTLIRVVKYVKVFAREDVFWSWLTVLARSSLYDNRRKRGRYRAFIDRFSEQTRFERFSADNAAGSTSLDEALKKKLMDLPVEERELIESKYTEGMSVSAIAEKLQMSEKAVESWLTRVRRKLKQAVLAELKNESTP
jgi:RNA polymerase sigma-70 factor (ECF subfamily)